MRRGTARHERSNLSKKSSGLLPEAEEAARIDQRIARYLADLDATDATENDDADAERTSVRNGPPAIDFQSGMILPTGIFEAFKHPLVSPLISPITGFFVSFPAVFLCGFPPGLTTGFLRNFTRNVIREIVVD